EQVANRLTYRVPGSEIVRQQSTGLNTFGSIATVADDGIANTTVFEWVGYDIDGFRGDGTSTRPTWSGFIDLAASQGLANTALSSPESNLTRINATIAALSPSGFNGNGLGMFFIQDSNFDVINGFGWNGVAIANQLSTVHPVSVTANDQLSTANGGNFGGQKISEFYKLSWTAYALEHNATSGQLRLYYDYRPWNGQTYTNGSSVLLMENVDTFSLRSIGDAIKVQVCIRDKSLFTNNAAKEFSICKEKTVF
ncbi:MAG: hypothetical protein Q8L68_05085, partial [Methylococcales bacterium]|nr:hypothetical protein [Methylococcales bacterium]